MKIYIEDDGQPEVSIVAKTNDLPVEKTCEDCAHYRPHYAPCCGTVPEFRGSRTYRGAFTKLYDGHCTVPRIKNRKAKTPACPYFEER